MPKLSHSTFFQGLGSRIELLDFQFGLQMEPLLLKIKHFLQEKEKIERKKLLHISSVFFSKVAMCMWSEEGKKTG